MPIGAAVLLAAWLSSPLQQAEVIAGVRVHGNHITPDEEVIRIAGITIGEAVGPATIEAVGRRLRESGRFDSVDVRKRFASIDDPGRILLVLIVNEGPVRIETPEEPGEAPRVVRRRGLANLMFLPILDAEDGYGLTFGARVAYAGLLGERSRLSSPLTWGGHRRAGIALDHTFVSGPIGRMQVGASVDRRRNPAFDEHDFRRRVWVRAERAPGPFRAGATAGWQRVSFGPLRDDIRAVSVDGALDTRLDAVLPRDAVYASASIERLHFEGGRAMTRVRIDGRGYLGLIGQPVLVVRVLREDTDAPAPPYLKSLLGGWSNLRGFRAGAFAGDTLVAGSLELRVPLNSPLEGGRIGVSVFMDAGAAYDDGERLADQRMRRGIGASGWITFTALRFSLSVAHGRGSGTRVNFGGGLTF